MPLYELTCSECDFKIETITTYSKIEELKCLQCGEEGAMKIAPSKPAGFRFKHTGFSSSSSNSGTPETIDYAKGPL